jgi:hypothetical protein
VRAHRQPFRRVSARCAEDLEAYGDGLDAVRCNVILGSQGIPEGRGGRAQPIRPYVRRER